MSWFTTVKSDIDAFLNKQVAPHEAEMIAGFQAIVPVLSVILPAIESTAGMSAAAKAVASQVVVTAQAVIGKLSSTPAVADIDSAFAAISAVATVLPPSIEPEALAAIGFAQSLYAQFKSGVVAEPASAPVPTGPAVKLASGTVAASA